ncbi:hypothetical protein BC939DRAFT_61243 [Gamsiella multidivaricata]|uniref:uncharacterized protein n=1 Tax=Gamsiella multidivaricata TaxID=101098 RepID=UPI00221FAF0C|nr:uncharacterized protein BC939DRAFT_61243 [Gamsiella multidivaricata]KAI7828601.1 hypothetical protein BC939DRAFT_61243 [Gamsiella multidivaricata]
MLTLQYILNAYARCFWAGWVCVACLICFTSSESVSLNPLLVMNRFLTYIAKQQKRVKRDEWSKVKEISFSIRSKYRKLVHLWPLFFWSGPQTRSQWLFLDVGSNCEAPS